MFYSINNGTWTSVSATTIQTCTSTSTECRFKATTPDLSAGDYVEYYWKFQDLNSGSNGANVGYDPAPSSGSTTPQGNAHTGSLSTMSQTQELQRSSPSFRRMFTLEVTTVRKVITTGK